MYLFSPLTFQPGQRSSIAIPVAGSKTDGIPYITQSITKPQQFALIITPDMRILTSSYPALYPPSTSVAQVLPRQISLIRAFLEAQADILIVGEAASGEEAIRQVQEHIPDVVLMDLVMPGMNGVESTREVRQVSPRTQVVVLTSYHEDEHIFPAL